MGVLPDYHNARYAAGSFRTGPFVVVLLLTNLPKGYPPSKLAALAQLVDNRLLHAH